MTRPNQTQLPEMFNPCLHDPTQSGGQLPVGKKLKLIVFDSEFKASSKDNENGMLVLKMRVVEGEHAGDEGHTNYNLINKNPKAVEIAKKELSALAHVVGQLQPFNNVPLLYNKPFLADIEKQKDQPQYTELKKVYDVNGNDPVFQGGGQATQQTQPQNNAFGGQQQTQTQQTTGFQQPAQNEQPQNNDANEQSGVGQWGNPQSNGTANQGPWGTPQ